MKFILALLAVSAGFALGGLLGAPYLPTRKRDYDGIFELLDLKSGQTLYELGSGDGGLLRAAAQRGVKAIGYEVNPWLWVWSSLRLLPYRGRAEVRLASFWRADLSQADAVYVFLIPKRMAQLADKLRSAGQPLKVLSYAFTFPGIKAVKSRQNYWLYRF